MEIQSLEIWPEQLCGKKYVSEGNKEKLVQLIQQYPEVLHKNYNGEFLLFIAIKANPSLFDFLVDLGADIFEKFRGDSTLIYSILYGRDDIFFSLIDKITLKADGFINNLAEYEILGYNIKISQYLRKYYDLPKIVNNFSQPLCLALYAKKIEYSKYLIENYEIDLKDPCLGTPCLLASEEIADMLVEMGYEIDRWYDPEITSSQLRESIASGSKKYFMRFLDGGAKVDDMVFDSCSYYCNLDAFNELWNRGYRAVIHNCLIECIKGKGDINYLNRMIELGGKIDDKNEPPLLYAIWKGNVELAKYIIEKGVDIDKLALEYPLIIYSLRSNVHEMFEFVRNTLTNPDYDGEYDPIFGNCFNMAVHQNDIEAVKFLSTRVSSLSTVSEGLTPYERALSFGSIEMIQLLEEIGAKSFNNSLDENLISVALHGNFNNFIYVLRMGGNVNQNEEFDGMTILQAAAANNQTSLIISYLLDNYSFDLNKTTEIYTTPLLLSIYNSNNLYNTMELLKRGADFNTPVKGKDPFIFALEKRNQGAVEFMIEHGFDINKVYNNGQTALHILASTGLYEHQVKFLLEHGMDPNAIDGNGNTPLMYSAAKGLAQNVIDLLEHGADPNIVCNGITAIFNAISMHHSSIVRILIEYGCDVNIKNFEGMRPMTSAIIHKDWEIVEMLAASGAYED